MDKNTLYILWKPNRKIETALGFINSVIITGLLLYVIAVLIPFMKDFEQAKTNLIMTDTLGNQYFETDNEHVFSKDQYGNVIDPTGRYAIYVQKINFIYWNLWLGMMCVLLFGVWDYHYNPYNRIRRAVKWIQEIKKKQEEVDASA